ncbi:type II secretion system protein [Clostridium akagii]|uniref:type II secretion system protein n=1 Tax=Clostridium akagii TaxID=91623 RepID=UPI00068B0F7C|nr:type II secretion system protein [Clostridium akagii]
MYDIKNKKKSGFTLIEVIVVIAILAILGAILVPNVLGYRQKAEKSNIQTSAKTIVSSIETYNADKDKSTDEISDASGAIGYADGISDLVSAKMLDQSKIPKCLDGTDGITSVADLQKVANGDFSVTAINGTESTIAVDSAEE